VGGDKKGLAQLGGDTSPSQTETFGWGQNLNFSQQKTCRMKGRTINSTPWQENGKDKKNQFHTKTRGGQKFSGKKPVAKGLGGGEKKKNAN